MLSVSHARRLALNAIVLSSLPIACSSSTRPSTLAERLDRVHQADVCQGTSGCTAGNPPFSGGGGSGSTARWLSGSTGLVLTEPSISADSQATWDTKRTPSFFDGQQVSIINLSGGTASQAGATQAIRPTNDIGRCLGVGAAHGFNATTGRPIFAATWQSSGCAPLRLFGAVNGTPLGGVFATDAGGNPVYRLFPGHTGDPAGTQAFWEKIVPGQGFPLGMEDTVIPIGMRVNLWPAISPTQFLTRTSPGVVSLSAAGPVISGDRQPTGSAQDWYLAMTGQDSDGFPLVSAYSALTSVPRTFGTATNVLDAASGQYVEGPQNANTAGIFFSSAIDIGGTGIGYGTVTGGTCMTDNPSSTSVQPTACTISNGNLVRTQVFGIQVRQ